MKKVNLLCLLILGLFFAACHSNDDTWGDWGKSAEFGGDMRTGAVCFQIGDVVYVGMGFNILNNQQRYLNDFWKFKDGAWSKVAASFPDTKGRFGAVAFVIGNKAYVGAGYRKKLTTNDPANVYFKDFYVFDGQTETWSGPIDDEFPGDPFYYGVAFSLNNKGYVGTGQIDGRQSSQFYSYDPSAAAGSRWQETPWGGDSRVGAVAMVIGNKAVVATGSGSGGYVTDVRVFDGSNWKKAAALADIDGQGWDNDYNEIQRAYAVAFTSNRDQGVNLGYVAGGQGGNARTCWQYNIDTDRWDEVTEFPSRMSTRVAGVGFSINGYGYITTGGSTLENPSDNSTWQFTPGVDEDDYNDY